MTFYNDRTKNKSEFYKIEIRSDPGRFSGVVSGSGFFKGGIRIRVESPPGSATQLKSIIAQYKQPFIVVYAQVWLAMYKQPKRHSFCVRPKLAIKCQKARKTVHFFTKDSINCR